MRTCKGWSELAHSHIHSYTPHLPPASCQFWHRCLFPGIRWRRGGLWIHMWLPSEAVAQQRCPPQGCAPRTQPTRSSAAPPVKACTSPCSPGCTGTAAPPSQWHGNSKDGVSVSRLVSSQFTVENCTVMHVASLDSNGIMQLIHQAMYGMGC